MRVMGGGWGEEAGVDVEGEREGVDDEGEVSDCCCSS